ncbi:PDDEXK family nuclease [Listeria marthii]|uniref:hypothetical protein n=1 Tax=Listeria marthii TaxID=529731 RepID=UPI001E35FB0A|nr:hypothetical protein [Listeria marthii]
MANTIFEKVPLVVNKIELLDNYIYKPSEENNDRLYFLDGVSKVTKEDESYLIYDCSNLHDNFVFEDYKRIENEKSVFTIPIMIFSDWADERLKFNDAYEKLRNFVSRKELIGFFERKISIYTDLKDSLVLNVIDEGINYLEYKVNSDSNTGASLNENMSGYIYNMTLAELKKIFNITGRDLFKKNVRNGLEGNITGKRIKEDFKDYMRVFIYSRIERQLKEQKKEHGAQYLEEFKNQFMIDDEKMKNRKPEKFWFYHNGVTIFSFDDKEIVRMGSTIEVNPKKISVINGAQTLTNFYIGLEELSFELKNLTQEIGSNDFQAEIKEFLLKNLDKVEENIVLKTIFINGTEEDVEAITFGLNTQIPIQETAIIANSVEVAEINKILNKNKITILKDGENTVVGIGLTVRDFAKQYLVIENKPGSSKNLNIRNIKKVIIEAQKSIKDDGNIYSLKLEQLVEIDNWWKNIRELKNDETFLSLESYGKNYFESFVLLYTKENQDLDSDQLGFLYDKFLQEFSNLAEHSLDAKDFKKDDLYNIFLKDFENRSEDDACNHKVEIDNTELQKYIVENKENNYTSRLLIMKYLESKKIIISDFRVISMINDSAMEAYAFSNSTFNELFYGKDYKKIKFKKYEESKFYNEIKKEFPVFIIQWSDKERSEIDDVFFIENFTFKKYNDAAKKVYNDTVEAFKTGIALKFPKSSDNLAFHVRPKAVNKQDTFEFSNGELMTKQTFWANKNTVEAIVNNLKRSQNNKL